jgi:hypothetical protein
MTFSDMRGLYYCIYRPLPKSNLLHLILAFFEKKAPKSPFFLIFFPAFHATIPPPETLKIPQTFDVFPNHARKPLTLPKSAIKCPTPFPSRLLPVNLITFLGIVP